MNTIIEKGYIRVVKNYDSGGGVNVGERPLSSILKELCGKQVNVRFYVSNEEKSPQELKENLIISLAGALHADYSVHFSDYTGHLWTDDNLTIGHHDLLYDISEHEGKYAYIEIDVIP